MIRFTIRAAQLASALGLAALAMPVAAEVVQMEEHRFLTRDEALVSASPKEVWLALISPARWWNSAHTWSGEATNLKLTPQAGGCFCESIPEVDEPGRFTLAGSVEHMRVIQAYPERALVMRGALGPLQPEPVAGVLTIAISEVEEGTRIVWEYNVGGFMRFETEVIGRAVDGVMSQQLAGLADMLGRLDVPEGGGDPEPQSASAPADSGGVPVEPEAAIEDAPGERGSSVEEAFGDLAEDEG